MTDALVQDVRDYMKSPAAFTPDVLVKMFKMLGPGGGEKIVLDPFAGNGVRFHTAAANCGWRSRGVELEPEFANADERNTVGDATRMSMFADDSFDAVLTSPTYGNRMADNYDGRDGSDRITYRIALGHDLTKGNTGGMAWGSEYRAMHALAWTECRRVLRPGASFILNVKDHIRSERRQLVANWHVRQLLDLGFILTSAETIKTPGMRKGANSKARVDGELVVAFELDPSVKDGRML